VSDKPSKEELRRRAEEVRRLAAETNSPGARSILERIAALWEGLAKWGEKK
jgi:hypothetical protein